MKTDFALKLGRHVSGQLHCRFVQSNPMVVAVEHILKVIHDGSVQADIVWIVHTISQCVIGVIDVELGIDRLEADWEWEEGSQPCVRENYGP